jgi:glucose-6-phosphate isomerase
MGTRTTIRLSKADQATVDPILDRARDEAWAERLFARDTSLWTDDDDVAQSIADRLGWLDAPQDFSLRTAALEGFGDGIVEAGFDQAVVMGMGGSSLAPDVLHRTFGTAAGYLDLHILDSTDPAAVSSIVDRLDPLETLWIVASKSGTTTEPLAFMADAWARVESELERRGSGQRPGEFFVAITDPDKSVESIPHHDALRETFLNPPDVGGRYSALTYVGLVPASLIGLDIDALLAAGAGAIAACREPEPGANPGLELGVVIGALAQAGRDKLTFLTHPAVGSFGAWAEQLIAESTGKHGVGIVPVDLEPPRAVDGYGPDRVFVELTLAGSDDAGRPGRQLLDDLQAAGHPVIEIELDDPIDLAAEMVRWEVATAFAGAVLGIDPFDQPNVEEAKELTRKVLAGAGDEAGAVSRAGGDARGDAAARARSGEADPGLVVRERGEDGLVEALRPTLSALEPPSYVAIQAFIAPCDAQDQAIARLRSALATTRCATTAGYGPRFLHSTGQLHKGGPQTGVYLQLTADHPNDRPIPGWPYSFGRLVDAQARGDRDALRAHDRPVIHLHLGADLPGDLAILERAIARALAQED